MSARMAAAQSGLLEIGHKASPSAPTHEAAIPLATRHGRQVVDLAVVYLVKAADRGLWW